MPAVPDWLTWFSARRCNWRGVGISTLVVLLGAAGVIAFVVVSDSTDRSPPPTTDVARPAVATPFSSSSDVTPFTNVAPRALKNGSDRWPDQVWNYRPGVVVFDYDRDGDLDFYVTAEHGHPNLLYRNDGEASFVNVAEVAGVAAVESHSSGGVACDVDNDGYQDLYVGGRGLGGSRLDFRSAAGDSDGSTDLRTATTDRLFLNDGNGAFREITDSAFGDAANLRSASSAACADVDGDGWLDIFVGNLVSEDFRDFSSPNHPGHYNVLYRNNGDLTFADISQTAGVRGPPITLRDLDGHPIEFEDPETGETFEGYDPTVTDKLGNRVGEPTGQTHAVLFFDYDDDRDLDLWVANDGDRLHLFRNDSSPGQVRFVPVASSMGIDKVGAWMGFAVGDYDGDSDLDVFATNMGFHPLLMEPRHEPSAICSYSMRFDWGTCSHFLLRNDGSRDAPADTPSHFTNVASSTDVVPSPLMPPMSLDPSNLHPEYEAPTGLAAYDFGFGATFFDFDNDGDQDLYWLGSTTARGQGPGGDLFPSAGRMLRADGSGTFEDITVRAHLLDIQNFDYSSVDPEHPGIKTRLAGLLTDLHENGKGLAHGDFNSDGYVDLVATNSSGPIIVHGFETQMLRGPIFLWFNGGGANHWLKLRLNGRMAIDGTGSNADGIGARVYLKTTPKGDSEPTVQVQEVRAGSSYLSMDSIDLEFGLGAAAVVDEITVLWPSGRRQVLTDISADQAIAITEPKQ